MDLVISHVYKDFGRGPVLRDVSLTVRQGETVCLMGPSGLGKTTLLRCVAGLERPESGSITGVPERLGYVFQEDRLLEQQDWRGNLRFVLGSAFEPEQRYEAPDGSPLTLDTDMCGQKHVPSPLPGPFAAPISELRF